LRIVHAAASGVGEGAGFEEMLEAHPELLNKGTLAKYYSDELLSSDAARRYFAEADRAALPELIGESHARHRRS
jgi:hypothetical protein